MEKISTSEAQEMPHYWRNSLLHIEQALKQVKRGQVRSLAVSAGGREIAVVEYGEKQPYNRLANYNSACGAGDTRYYKDKTINNRPVILIIGGIHGGELEGVAAVLNLIHALETGTDLRGKQLIDADRVLEQFRLLLIPCMNPDGRARVPVESVLGMTMEELRYFVQGAWQDGSLCGWPDCKAIHPILEHAGHLGGYFNDNGINMMHDQFFMPWAEETKALLKLADEEAVDVSVQLHGGTNVVNQILNTAYIPLSVKRKQLEFCEQLKKVSDERGLRYLVNELNERDGEAGCPPSFNLASAMHHVSGGMSMVYETNMGLDAPGECYGYEEIMDSHMTLFEQLFLFNYSIE
ncbi:M14 family zinc carboxypeptidase [Paenibacillus sp. GXUN7292]|uniref:M14 family zinc carboxypeptidase n=1 Tax=Paenibacillus sp. GXUN7292 TaxID=3422499 RepID=UPI003D7E4CC6